MDRPGKSAESAGGTQEPGLPPAAARLRDAVARITTGGASRDELQDAAKELVKELRCRQQTAEQALIQIKRVLAEAGLDAAGATLYQDVIAWSIRHYYSSE